MFAPRTLSALALTMLLGSASACDDTPAAPVDGAVLVADAASRPDATTTDAAPADALGQPDAEPAADALVDAGVAEDAAPAADASPADSGAVEDAAAPDAAVDAGAADAAPVDGGSGPGCGGARPDISGIRGTEGLVIARDGTIYYSTRGGVGRLVPGGTPQTPWVSVGAANATVWGLALDATNQFLYVGSPTTGSVHRIDTTAATPSATVFVAMAGSPNGLTMGPDGWLYFSDFNGNQVYRADTTGATATRTRVTTSNIASANGVAFLADGSLLVGSYANGNLYRLTLSNGSEDTRATLASSLGSIDGVAVDAAGSVYITDQSGRRVVRLDANGMNPTNLVTNVASPANLEFGVGALDCEDLYITSSGTMRRYEAGTTAGAAVPWH